MPLMDDIKAQVEEERKSWLWYSRLADDADNAGMHRTAKDLRKIADDEHRHGSMLSQLYQSPEFGPTPTEEPGPGGETVELPDGRLLPRTYGYWVNLAESIKTRDPDSRFTVNNHLYAISNETTDMDAARRWLMNKARELGMIK